MKTRREEIARKWNNYVYNNNSPADIANKLYGGDDEAMYADLEEYLGDDNTVIIQKDLDEDGIEMQTDFSFPERRDRTDVIMSIINQSASFGLSIREPEILISCEEEDSWSAINAFALTDTDRTVVLNHSVRLGELEMISFDEDGITYILKGSEDFVSLSYADYVNGDFSSLTQRLCRLFAGSLRLGKGEINLAEEAVEWEAEENEIEDELSEEDWKNVIQ